LVPRFGIVDPLLEQLAIALADALRTGSVGTASISTPSRR